MMITIIDVGSGNIRSVQKVLNYLDQPSIISEDPQEILRADRVILPGVGNFGRVMQELRNRNLESVIRQIAQNNTPLLGICVGLQIMFQESEESPGISGLGLFKGKVIKFTKGKIPQIGWNKLMPNTNLLFPEGYAYFVNSYYVMPEDPSLIAASSDYFGIFTAAVQKDNILAVQFHPEKSGQYGIDFYRRWLTC